MRRYQVAEVFYSLQGEGIRVGTPTVFVRFAGCNLTCDFCDTDHTKRMELDARELLELVVRNDLHSSGNVVFTGGEPLLQVDTHLVSVFKLADFHLSLETNGTIAHAFGTHFDWVTVSPKHAAPPELKHPISEWRCPVDVGQQPYEPLKVVPLHKLVSPIFTGHKEHDARSLDWAVEWVLTHPPWRLSTQQHKLVWRIP